MCFQGNGRNRMCKRKNGYKKRGYQLRLIGNGGHRLYMHKVIFLSKMLVYIVMKFLGNC